MGFEVIYSFLRQPRLDNKVEKGGDYPSVGEEEGLGEG